MDGVALPVTVDVEEDPVGGRSEGHRSRIEVENDRGGIAIVGSPETVRKGIEAAAEEYGADEMMIVTITFDHEDRKRSYELIAKAFAAV